MSPVCRAASLPSKVKKTGSSPARSARGWSFPSPLHASVARFRRVPQLFRQPDCVHVVDAQVRPIVLRSERQTRCQWDRNRDRKQDTNRGRAPVETKVGVGERREMIGVRWRIRIKFGVRRSPLPPLSREMDRLSRGIPVGLTGGGPGAMPDYVFFGRGAACVACP